MSDVLTPAQRSRCMSAIRSRNTQPELIVRRLCHAMGFRYRLHGAGLPGHPDMVFPGLRKVILIHGCFWHRHRCRYGKVMPATRAEFWQAKFSANRRRDRIVRAELRSLGWTVLVIWECETRNPEKIAGRLSTFLASDSNSRSCSIS
jgi:DNA mismatch endonuclease (patch repair protein)